ncbi:MAG: PAS domain S-box protein [Fimbriimonadaceae bacterium]|nr:PAS domain S-box protein [Chitinophagales bacterium]
MQIRSKKTTAKQEKQKKFVFTYLPLFAKFLRDEKLGELVEEQYNLSYELKLPMLKYFASMPKEQIVELSTTANIDFLNAVIENKLEETMEAGLKAWKENQLPILARDKYVERDLVIGHFIRKRSFSKFLKDYTTDVQEAVQILDELEQFSVDAQAIGFKAYIDLQQEKINEQLLLIQKNEHLYKQAQAIANIGNFSLSLKDNKVIWSDEVYRIFGMEPQSEDINFEKFKSFIHPDDRIGVSALIKETIDTGKNTDSHYRLILKDGTIKIVHGRREVIKDESGKPIQLIGTIQDATAEKLSEQDLLAKQSFIQKIADISPSLIAAYNINTGKYIFINHALQTLLGYDPQLFLKEGVSFFMNLIHPDDLIRIGEENAQALAEANSAERNGADEKILEFKYRIKHINGEYRCFHTFGTIFDRNMDGTVDHVLNISMDITNEDLLRKNAEKEKAFAETLIENSPYMILAYDKEMRITAWNKKSEEHTGFKKEQVIGKSTFELFPQYNNEVWLNEIKRVFKGESLHYPKVKFEHNKGWGESFVVPLKNTKNEVFGLLSITNNITEQVTSTMRLEEINEELRQSEERYHKMIDEIEDYAIILMDTKGNIQNWNRGAEKIKGYKTAEIIGKNFRQFYTEEDRKSKLPEKLIEQAFLSGKANHEGTRVRKDGTTFWGSILITALHDDHNNIIGFSKITRDLTEKKLTEENLKHYTKELERKNAEFVITNEELKQARRQLADDRTRYLLETIPHIIATATPYGTLDYVNKNLLEYTGLSATELMQGKWFDLVHADDIEKLSIAWEASFHTGENLQTEFRIQRADGIYLWHLGIAKPLRDENDDIILWIVTLTNIHDQKIIEDKKDEFIGIASHELKTPLTSVKAYAQLLQLIIDKDENEEAAMYIDKLNNLISELLDITRIQHGKLPIIITEFGFDILLKETVDMIQSTSQKHIIKQQGNSSVIINADKERIQQVLINLLSNAVKYSPGSDTIEVKVKTKDNLLHVTVTDNGIGIPKGDLNKVFERFYRVEGDDKFQGLGIGLFISSEIINRHNGRIWVESEPGKGSAFHFTIPLLQ